MTRMRRSFEQFGWFHVTNRGVDRQDIFVDDIDRDRFVEFTVEAAARFDIEIHAFCLMSNHFHVIVNCVDGSLSDFMQRLQRRYVEHYNHRVGRVGHLFGGRFRSTALSEDESRWDPDSGWNETLEVAGRYVHRNLLDAMTLEKARRTRFSSYGYYLGLRATPMWLRTDLLLAGHNDDRRALASFTERQHPSDKTPGGGREVIPYTPQEVIAAVATVAGVSTSAVEQTVPGRPNESRDLAAHLCVALRTGDPDTFAQVFRVESQSAFRRLATRGKDRCGADDVQGRRRDRVLSELWRAHTAIRHNAA